MVLLQRQIAHRHAMGMLLTGRRIKAAEALAFGLVNEVVPRADLDAVVDRWISDIMACAPLAVRAIKSTVRRTAQMSVQEAQRHRHPALVAALKSEDSKEGVQAFLEKRKPLWLGQ
jgi:crotonobetainyl-CoA hydratase